ncbi:SAM-dependent methyltransferase [Actinophytocola sp. KF-1]
MGLPRSFTIRESGHRIHNPFSSAKLATLGAALRVPPGAAVLDLACGSGELLCTWARDQGVTDTGVDISAAFLAKATARAEELGVADKVTFVHAACVGATWIGGGVAGAVDLLRRSLRPAAFS